MKNIFLSRPNKFDPIYQNSVDKLTEELDHRGLYPITIGSTVFPNGIPVKEIKKQMHECKGIIILGIPQILIKDGIYKPGSENETRINNKLYPSVWNQIEGAMAFIIGIPIMIIADNELKCDGLFENGTLPLSTHRYNLKNSDWINDKSFIDPFNEWIGELE
ncbi:hypothetical protein M3M35_02840 [Fructilactobacillus myrtifloralis]|uniref:Uncharacterized protein n=1 Tax=Fructilactobacillus myrtifloralis TaxID=2940301 RepID=A0ABY5BRQ5_9LACO|nr:hypothetical protein [Fructilactobacillus myrtifloralis]USS85596.1 hypothetical protein M3M35_02840 [Fructilactobacillus myrtifloralis]